MGYMRHHAILVTTGIREYIDKAHTKFNEILSQFNWDGDNLVPSAIIESPVNAYYSFFVPPDGSQENWELSDVGDKARTELIRWLWDQEYEDGSSQYAWALIQYGDENGKQELITASK